MTWCLIWSLGEHDCGALEIFAEVRPKCGNQRNLRRSVFYMFWAGNMSSVSLVSSTPVLNSGIYLMNLSYITSLLITQNPSSERDQCCVELNLTGDYSQFHNWDWDDVNTYCGSGSEHDKVLIHKRSLPTPLH